MKHQVELITPRLVLKSITPSLIRELFTHHSPEEIRAFFGVDDAGYKHLKSMYEMGMETHRLSLFYFLLVDAKDQRIIGECGFHTWNNTHRRAEVFYSLRNDSDKRKGLMIEALSKVLEYGFMELNLHRIEGLTASWNTPSIKLMERYGFTKEGTMREDYVVDGVNESSECYSLLKWEWEKRIEQS